MDITEIQEKVNSIFPLSEGQHDWDNIGIIIDTGSKSYNVLLTIDITDSIIEECIRKNIKNIISYHPVIFSGIKRIQKDSLVVKLIKNDINVFSPYTSWDKEMNNYITSLLKGLAFREIVDKLKKELNLMHLRVVNEKVNYTNIVVGVGSAFRYHDFKNTLIITGEMSHHCLLHSMKNNNAVILLEHSNSERLALPFLKKKLEGVLNGCEIFISEEDKDFIKIL